MDSVVAESDRGTLMLLLAYPVARWQVIAGKFCGHFALLSLAIVVGYGAAGVTIVATGSGDWADQVWSSLIGLIGSSILLGAVFIALGLMISARARERGTAAGMAIGIWLFFALAYDIGLIGLLASDAGQMLSEQATTALLLANPADVYRPVQPHRQRRDRCAFGHGGSDRRQRRFALSASRSAGRLGRPAAHRRMHAL